jgi:hypothetical protein
MLRLSLDCYVEEIPDYGIEQFVERWANAGVQRLRPTIAYHPVRIFSPGNPRRRMLDLEGDVFFLGSDTSDAFEGPVVPVFTRRSAGVLESLVDACRAVGMGVDGWLVTLNNWTLASRHPEVAVQSALGAPDCTWLSPAHPATHQYVIGLIRAIGGAGLVEELQVEALHHVPFPCHPCDRPGIGIPLSPVDWWLAGVCCSTHSMALVDECGGDGERLVRRIRAHLGRQIDPAAPGAPRTLELIGDVLGDGTNALLRSRELSITRLAAAAKEEARRVGLKLQFQDGLPSWEGFYTGEASGPLSGDRQWELGTNREELSSTLDSYLLLLYLKSADRMAAEIESYKQVIGQAPHVAIRPYWPDTASGEDLLTKLELFESLGVSDVLLYMQALMPEGTETVVRNALARTRGSRS